MRHRGVVQWLRKVDFSLDRFLAFTYSRVKMQFVNFLVRHLLSTFPYIVMHLLLARRYVKWSCT